MISEYDFYSVEDRSEFIALMPWGHDDEQGVYISDLMMEWVAELEGSYPDEVWNAIMEEWIEIDLAILRAQRYAALQRTPERFERVLAEHRANLPHLYRRLKRMLKGSGIRFATHHRPNKGLDLNARGGPGAGRRPDARSRVTSSIRQPSRVGVGDNSGPEVV